MKKTPARVIRGLPAITTKRLGSFLGIVLIAAVAFAQSGCAFLAGKAAVAVGKKVYEKVKDDKAKNERGSQG